MFESLLLLILLLRTVFTLIQNPWLDDFEYDFLNANNGWRVYFEDDPTVDIGAIAEFTSTSSSKTYHGPYQGGKFWMERNFQCGNWSKLKVTWSVAHCGIDVNKDHSTFYFNGQEQNKYNLGTTTIYTDSDLETNFNTLCGGGSWYTETFSEEGYAGIGGMQQIHEHDPFEIALRTRIDSSSTDELGFVYDIIVDCMNNTLPEPSRPPTGPAVDFTDEFCLKDSTHIVDGVDLNGDYKIYENCDSDSDTDCDPVQVNGHFTFIKENTTANESDLFIYTIYRNNGMERHVIGPTLGADGRRQYYARCNIQNVSFNIDPTACNYEWQVRNEDNPNRFRGDPTLFISGDFCGYEPQGGDTIYRSWLQVLIDFFNNNETNTFIIISFIGIALIIINTFICIKNKRNNNKKKHQNEKYEKVSEDEQEKFVDDLIDDDL